MKAFVFPGQGAQFVGMGKDLYENNPVAKEMFDKANEILGFNITDLMFNRRRFASNQSYPACYILALGNFGKNDG